MPARLVLDGTSTVVILSRLSLSVKVTIWRGADKQRAIRARDSDRKTNETVKRL